MPMEFRDRPPQKHETDRVVVWWCPKDGRKYLVRILEAPLWVEVHWRKGKSIACRYEDCPEKWHRHAPVWRGYAPAMRWDWNLKADRKEWIASVVELTPDVYPELQDKEFGDLLVVLKREPVDKAPLEMTGYNRRPRDCELPAQESWDIRPILKRLWRSNEAEDIRQEGKETPLRKFG